MGPGSKFKREGYSAIFGSQEWSTHWSLEKDKGTQEELAVAPNNGPLVPGKGNALDTPLPIGWQLEGIQRSRKGPWRVGFPFSPVIPLMLVTRRLQLRERRSPHKTGKVLDLLCFTPVELFRSKQSWHTVGSQNRNRAPKRRKGFLLASLLTNIKGGHVLLRNSLGWDKRTQDPKDPVTGDP